MRGAVPFPGGTCAPTVLALDSAELLPRRGGSHLGNDHIPFIRLQHSQIGSNGCSRTGSSRFLIESEPSSASLCPCARYTASLLRSPFASPFLKVRVPPSSDLIHLRYAPDGRVQRRYQSEWNIMSLPLTLRYHRAPPGHGSGAKARLQSFPSRSEVPQATPHPSDGLPCRLPLRIP